MCLSDVDHIQPLAEQGKDDPTNFAITHAHCNRSKQAADLRVARVMARFGRLQGAAQDAGRDSPNLGDVLLSRVSKQHLIQLTQDGSSVRYAFSQLSGAGANTIHDSELHTDKLSGMQYFFALLPLSYLFHDELINPRGSVPESSRFS